MTPNALGTPNQLAKSIIDIAAGQKPDREPMPPENGLAKRARAGGAKGGPARAAALTPNSGQR
jgi:hypothetical protein